MGGDIGILIEIFKALADETRVRILNLLKRGELCVCEIEVILGITQSNASRHLNKLKNAGIISSKKRGKWVYYCISLEFIQKHKMLYDYLDSQTDDIRFLKDNEKLREHKDSGITCEQLKDKNLKNWGQK